MYIAVLSMGKSFNNFEECIFLNIFSVLWDISVGIGS